MIKVFKGGEWVDGDPVVGDKYRKYDAGGGFIESVWVDVQSKQIIPVTNIIDSYVGFHRLGAGGIQTIQQETVCIITANVELPDNTMTIMLVELGTNDEWINAKYRFDAEIESGVMTLRIKLPIGNFLLSCDRINQGLDYVNAGFHLEFDDIQFNCIATV